MSGLTQFSPATENDLAELEQLVNSAYRGDSSKQGWTTEAEFLDGIRTDRESLQQMINQPGSMILKAVDDGTICACVYLQKQNNKLYLGMLTVSPILQAKGMGKILLAKAEEMAIEKGCDTITMTVITLRKELIAWYERRGYHSTGEIKPFPSDPKFGIPKQHLEFVVMEKKLQK